MTRIDYIQDPGHGWLKVPLSLFPEARNYGTGYGYDGGDCVYLEEDCEAGLFLAVHGDSVRLNRVDGSPRHLPPLACSHRHVYCSHKKGGVS